MNNLFLALPNFLLRNYVLSHFAELSVDDFFKIIDRVQIPPDIISSNDTLNRSASVLERMLDINIESFQYFDLTAFSPNCINKIADSGIEINPSQIDKYPILLENVSIRERTIKSYPHVVKRLDSNQITDKIVAILEEKDYTPDEEDLEKSSLFLNSEKLFTNAVSKNPSLLVKATILYDSAVDCALKNGFIPSKQHFYDNPNFKKNNRLLESGFENDPSVIIFYGSKINYQMAYLARQKGFIAEEDDLIFNPALCDFFDIMEEAIKNNPRLIVYTSEDCIIDHDLLINTLEQYTITKKDLEDNPQLTRNHSIMANLPEFRLYSAYLDYAEKKAAVLSCLENDSKLSTDELPFFDYRFGSKADIIKLSELRDYLSISIDDNDINEQQRYFEMLDKIIDGIVNIRYIENKPYYKYPDAASLNETLRKLFDNLSKTDDYELIKKFVNKLYDFVEKSLPIDQIREEIDELYQKHINDHIPVDSPLTDNFCNKILNQHRDCFMSKEKARILADLEPKMRLTDKKKNKIINGRKLKKVSTFISRGLFDKLGITEDEFQVDIENAKNSIINNKDIKKRKIKIDTDKLKNLELIFKFYGYLTPENVKSFLHIDDKDVIKFIINKFEKIKLKYIDNISLSENEENISSSEKQAIGRVNHTNYIIGDNKRYLQNLSELLVNLDDETLDRILRNKDTLKEVAFLLPFVNLIDELDMRAFINILANCERVKSKILGQSNYRESENYKSVFLKKFDDFLNLSNGYASVDDITLMAIGKKRVSKLGEHNASKYVDFYIHMLKRQSGNIPPISFETEEYKFESGSYSDPDRLLIGKIPKMSYSLSCIDLLNIAGTETYKELLLKNSGDVILIRDKNNLLISRLFLVRRGNVVQIVSSVMSKYSIDIYKKIADQIIQKSMDSDDNIEYVFVNSWSTKNESLECCPEIKSLRFITNFPHFDTCESAVLLTSKRGEQPINEKNLDFHIPPKVSYLKARKEISYEPTEADITRLRALSIVLENDDEKKENMSRNFEPFYSKEYSKTICGEDWYIAIKNDGTIEELILPLNDSRAKEELEQVKKSLGLSKINDIENSIE